MRIAANFTSCLVLISCSVISSWLFSPANACMKTLDMSEYVAEQFRSGSRLLFGEEENDDEGGGGNGRARKRLRGRQRGFGGNKVHVREFGDDDYLEDDGDATQEDRKALEVLSDDNPEIKGVRTSRYRQLRNHKKRLNGGQRRRPHKSGYRFRRRRPGAASSRHRKGAKTVEDDFSQSEELKDVKSTLQTRISNDLDSSSTPQVATESISSSTTTTTEGTFSPTAIPMIRNTISPRLSYAPAPVYISTDSFRPSQELGLSTSSMPSPEEEEEEISSALFDEGSPRFYLPDIISGGDGHIMGNGNNGWIAVTNRRFMDSGGGHTQSLDSEEDSEEPLDDVEAARSWRVS